MSQIQKITSSTLIKAGKCVVHETYANSEAVIAHNNSVASQTILPKVFCISVIGRLDVYGNPSEELQRALSSFTAQNFDLFAGFSRLC